MDENGLSHVSRYSWNKREIVPEALTSSGRMDGVLLWSFGLFSPRLRNVCFRACRR